MKSSYKTLFELKFIHHYFLDEGEDVYGVDMDAEMEEANYRLYNIADFLRIVPSARTEKVLRNWRARCIVGKDGLKVAIKADPSDGDKPFIDFDDSLFFDFLIQLKDPFFENYTDIEINREKLVYVSNTAPTAADAESETSSAIQHIELSNFGDPYTDMTIELGDTLSGSELIGTWGLVRIHLDGENSEIDLSDGAGNFAANTPAVDLVFTNRSTKWRFIDTSDSSVLHTSDYNPLTKNGYIKVTQGNQEFPNPTPELIITEETQQGNNTIITHYSEVFI